MWKKYLFFTIFCFFSKSSLWSSKNIRKAQTAALGKGTGKPPPLEIKTRLTWLPLSYLSKELKGYFSFSPRYHHVLQQEQYCLIDALEQEGLLEFSELTHKFSPTDKILSSKHIHKDIHEIVQIFSKEMKNNFIKIVYKSVLYKLMSSIIYYIDEAEILKFLIQFNEKKLAYKKFNDSTDERAIKLIKETFELKKIKSLHKRALIEIYKNTLQERALLEFDNEDLLHQNNIQILHHKFINKTIQILSEDHSMNFSKIYGRTVGDSTFYELSYFFDENVPFEKQDLDNYWITYQGRCLDEYWKHKKIKEFIKKFLTYKEFKILMDMISEEKNTTNYFRSCHSLYFYERIKRYLLHFDKLKNNIHNASYLSYDSFSYACYLFNKNIGREQDIFSTTQNSFENNLLLQIRNVFFSSGFAPTDDPLVVKDIFQNFTEDLDDIDILFEKFTHVGSFLEFMKIFLHVKKNHGQENSFFLSSLIFLPPVTHGIVKAFHGENRGLFLFRSILSFMNIKASFELYEHFLECPSYAFHEFVKDFFEENIYLNIFFHGENNHMKISYEKNLKNILERFFTPVFNEILTLLPKEKILPKKLHLCENFPHYDDTRRNHGDIIQNINKRYGLNITPMDYDQ